MLDATDIKFILVMSLIIVVPLIMGLYFNKNLHKWETAGSVKNKFFKMIAPFLIILPIITQIALFGIDNIYMWKVTFILIVIALIVGYGLSINVEEKSKKKS